MKKIVNLFLIVIMALFLFPNVNASNNITVDNITLIEKSDNVLELSKPKINGMDLGFDLSFLNIGDYAKYKVEISNNTNKDYYINKENKFSISNYISYKYEFDDNITKIKKNSKLTVYLTIKYEKNVPVEKLVNGMYIEENSMSIDLSDIILTNPSTYSNIILLLLIFISLIVFTIINITKKKKIGINILLIGLLLIPITTYALEKITVKAQIKITIEEQRNIIESMNEAGIQSNGDFWQYKHYIKTITFETNIEEPSNYAYKFDVSEAKNNSIIAYLVEKNDDSTYYDLYIMSNGYIYANPDSRNFFSTFVALKEFINIENFKTNYAVDMSNMFAIMYNIEELDLSSFDTSNVTDMSYMFSTTWGSIGGGILKKINFSNWNTSKVETMKGMFQEVYNLEELDLSSFDTSNVTDMSYMFESCHQLKTIDLSSFNTEKVINMNSMFCYCNKLESLDLSNFNTSNVKNMAYMFTECYNITNINISNFDTSKVTNMPSMFRSCKKLNTIDITSFNTSNVTNMEYMFYNDENLENIYVSNLWNISKVEKSNDMFNYCTKLPNYNSYYVDKTRANTSDTGYLTLKS